MSQADIRIEKLDRRVRFHFGESRGYKEFDSMADLRREVLPWITKRMAELARTIKELSDVQRQLIGPAPLGELLDKDE